MSLEGIGSIVGASLKFALPCFMLWLIVRSAVLYFSEKEHKIKKEIVLSTLVFYVLALIGVTVYRYGIEWSALGDLSSRMDRINFVPLKEMIQMAAGGIGWSIIYNVMGNIAWFVPLGFLIPVAFKKKATLKNIASIGFGVSLSIEVLQCLFRTGIADVDDVIFNVIGALVGYGIYCIGSKMKKI